MRDNFWQNQVERFCPFYQLESALLPKTTGPWKQPVKNARQILFLKKGGSIFLQITSTSVDTFITCEYKQRCLMTVSLPRMDYLLTF